MHLWWRVPPLDGPVVAASVLLEVLTPPSTADLWFWALQASFGTDGAAHLGLQWHPSHPGSTAANFGGYASAGGELDGSVSPRPSALHNPNTRDFPWSVGRPYQLTIAAAEPGSWSGSIDGEQLRRLRCAGDDLRSFVMWTECFAPCDAPPCSVRWSDPSLTTASGAVLPVTSVDPTYQSVADGGCSTGRSDPDGSDLNRAGWRQTTGAPR